MGNSLFFFTVTFILILKKFCPMDLRSGREVVYHNRSTDPTEQINRVIENNLANMSAPGSHNSDNYSLSDPVPNGPGAEFVNPPVLSPQAASRIIPAASPSHNSFLPSVTPPMINRVTPFLASVPNFDGNVDILDSFFDTLDRVALYAQWAETDKIFALSLKLKGEAADFYQNNLSKRGLSSYIQLKCAIIERFQRKELPRQVLRQLCLAYQKPQESVREYASRLEALSYKAFSMSLQGSLGGDEARCDTLRGAFVDGLRPSLRRVVHHLSPRTFEEAVKIAIEEEELFAPRDLSLDVAHEKPVSVAAVAPEQAVVIQAQQDLLNQLASTVSELSKKVEALTVSQSKTQGERPRSNRITCFGCGQTGHIRRNCRVPNMNNRDTGNFGNRNVQGNE